MLFSVVIPVFNVESYLRSCLDSLIGQTCSDWEAICVNDGSTDGSAAIMEEYAVQDGRLRIITQSNKGLSAARNVGMVEAVGDYILFLDSDDWLEPDALKTIASELDGEDMVCFSGRRYFEATSSFNPADQLEEKTYETGMDYYNENALLHHDFAFVCAVLRAYKRTFLMENHLFFKDGIYHEDNLFTPIVCFLARKVKQIKACLYDYRVRSNSITTTDDMKRLRDMMGTANDLAAFFAPKSGFDKTVVYQAITHHYQVAFLGAKREERKEFKRLCDWKLYRIVSRTKLRHRMNYLRNRML